MNNFYDNNEDEIRSKLNNHQFEMRPGAWEDMEKRLNMISGPIQHPGNKTWGSWVFTGLVSAAALTGILLYAYHTPVGTESRLIGSKEVQLLNKNKPVNPFFSKEDNDKNATPGIATANILPPIFTDDFSSSEHPAPAEHRLTAASPEVRKEEDQSKNVITNSKQEIFIPKKKIEIKYNYNKKSIQSFCNLKPYKANNINLNIDEKDSSIVLLDIRKAKKNKSLQMGVESGIAVNIANPKFAAAPVAGVFVRKNLNPKQAIQADLQYKVFLIANPPSQNEITVEIASDNGIYSTYSRKNAKINKLNQLHLIELPVTFIQKINSKHSVSLGVSAAYLCAAGSSHHTAEGHSNSRIVFNKINVGALTGYTYKIKNNLELTIYCQVGLINMINSNAVNQLYAANNQDNYNISEGEMAKIPDGEAIVPLDIDEDNQSFFQTPEKFYNTDLRMMLRYLF